MKEFVRIVGVWIALFDVGLARVDAVPDAGASRLGRAPAKRAVVHLARVVVPEVLVQAVRVTDFARQLLHRAVVF